MYACLCVPARACTYYEVLMLWPVRLRRPSCVVSRSRGDRRETWPATRVFIYCFTRFFKPTGFDTRFSNPVPQGPPARRMRRWRQEGERRQRGAISNPIYPLSPLFPRFPRSLLEDPEFTLGALASRPLVPTHFSFGSETAR